MLEAGNGNITTEINDSGQFDGQTTEYELDKNKKKEHEVQKTQNNQKIHDHATSSTRKVTTVNPIRRFKLMDVSDENTRNESCLVGGYESKVFGIRKIRNSKQKVQEDKFLSAISTQISNKSKSLSTTSHTFSNKVSRDSVQGITEDGKTLRRNNFADPKGIHKPSSKYFPVVQNVDRSVSLRKYSVLSTRFKCHLCTNVYKSNRSLKEHLITHSQKYQCEQCGLCCRNNYNLVLHCRTHNGEKPYACKLCDKTFSLKGSLNRHNLVHTGQKKQVCQFCQKTFTRYEHLDQHMRIHTREKPFVCKLCSKRFSRYPSLLRHTFVHTGEQKYICKFCQKRFTQHGNLASHIRTHTREKPYGCDICSKTFSHSSNLIRHKSSRHNISFKVPNIIGE